MKIAAIIAATCFIGCAFAQADTDWIKYGEGGDGSIFYFSMSRLKKLGDSGKVFRVWVNRKLTTPQSVFKDRPLKYSSNMTMMVLNCDAQTLTGVTASYYDQQGIVVHTDSSPEAATAIVPGSVGESLSTVICGN